MPERLAVADLREVSARCLPRQPATHSMTGSGLPSGLSTQK